MLNTLKVKVIKCIVLNVVGLIWHAAADRCGDFAPENTFVG